MNEFSIINKYFKPLSKKNSAALKLNDDIFFDIKKGVALSTDSYVQGIHFIKPEPKYFLKKILRASLSDLYCKGIKPNFYFLSLSLNKSIVNHLWLKKFVNILKKEQKKFNISLAGGDTTYSTKFSVTVTVLGYSKNRPILRKGCCLKDDIYISGEVGDAFLGLNIIKKKYNFGKYNNFFKKKYHEPNLPFKIYPYLNKIASSSIDVSDGLAQDLGHICENSKFGATIDLNAIPLSTPCKNLVKRKKIKVKNIFSNGDDYQVLFTSNRRNRKKILKLSKKLSLKITRIGLINKGRNIIFKHNSHIIKLNPGKMGFTHTF